MTQPSYILAEIVDRGRLYTLVAALETDLRAVLASWVLPFKNEDDVYGGRRQILHERARKDGQDPGDVALLDYADFADSFEFLNRNAAMLPEEVAHAVKSRTPRLAQFIGPRNRVMHSRPLEVGDLDLGLQLCFDLLDDAVPLPTLRVVVAKLSEDPDWSPSGPLVNRTSVTGVLHNLPWPEFDETGLVGRERERREVLDRLKRRREPVVTLVGEGGMGKTALAVQTLYDLADDPDCPYEAILWSSLKSEKLTGEGVESIADAASDVLGLSRSLGSALDEGFAGAPESLGELLSGIECLLVIDNVETIDAGEILRFYDAMPDSGNLLLTSRVGLGQLERRVPVGPLERDAGAKMLRLFAQRRGVKQLAQLDHKVLSQQVVRLRATPLAIRWFVEAVGAGAEPQMAISDQSELLRFCLQTIYADLSELARHALSVMYAAGTPLDAAQLAVMTDSAADELARALQDLQRRSLTEVSLEGTAGLHQRYGPTAATAQYLASVDRPSLEILRAADSRLAELRESEEHRQRGASTSVNFISVLDDGQKAVAHLLRKAVLVSKRDGEAAKAVLVRADGLAPGYFETSRIEAYIASQEERYDAADMLYRRSYELAPDDFHRARVAYFWSWSKAFGLGELQEALELAEEAARTLSIPAATARLAQLQITANRFSEAEALLRSVLGSDDPRTILIARTQLIRLAKRRVEQHQRDKAVGEAVRVGAAAIVEVGAYLDTGIADTTLRARVLDLALETVNVYLRAPGLAPENDVAKIISYALRHSTELLLSSDRQYWQRAAQRCATRDDVPVSVVSSMGRLLLTVQEKEDSELLHGKIFSFDVERGYGFITQPQSAERLFFHRSNLSDPRTEILLARDLPVTFMARQEEKGIRASKVVSILSRDEELELLTERHLRVYKRDNLYAFAHDELTGVSIYIDSRTMPGFQWDSLQEGVALIGDVELGVKGPRARTGTLRAAAEPPNKQRGRA